MNRKVMIDWNYFRQLEWNYWQIAVALFLAFDIGGGMVCNSLNSCKRFYHSPLKEGENATVRLAKNHLAFSVIHIHPIKIIYGHLVREEPYRR